MLVNKTVEFFLSEVAGLGWQRAGDIPAEAEAGLAAGSERDAGGAEAGLAAEPPGTG